MCAKLPALKSELTLKLVMLPSCCTLHGSLADLEANCRITGIVGGMQYVKGDVCM